MIEQLVTGPLKVNTFIVSLGGNNVFVVDPATCDFCGDTDVIAQYIREHNLSLSAIILTHGHFDHIAGVAYLKKCFPDALVCIHKDDSHYIGEEGSLMQQKSLEGIGFTEFLSQVKDLPNSDCFLQGDKTLAECMNVSSLELSDWKVIHTPGHTKGSCCLYSAKQKALISGDTVFFRSYGRTDLPGGSEEDLINSLSFLYCNIKEDVKVYPGHGEYGFEFGNN